MKKIAKLLCFVMAVLTVSLAFAGCNKDEKGQESKAPEVSANSDAESKDNFPLEKKKWDKKITIGVGETDYAKYEYGMYYDENGDEAFKPNTDPVNDACYDRTALIAQQFGLETDVHILGSGSVGPVQQVENDIVSGDHHYDIIAGAVMGLTKLGTQGFIYDLKEIGKEYIHFDAPYWDQPFIRDVSIGGKLHYIAGDATVSDKAFTWGMFYNKDMIKAKGLVDPVTLVDKNEWTVDKMHEIAKQATEKKSEGDRMSFTPEDGDVFGMVMQSYDGLSFMWGCGQAMIEKDEDDLPVMRFDDPRNIKAWQSIITVILDEANVGFADNYGAWDSGVYESEKKIFCNGNALFMPNRVGSVEEETFENSTVNYGILPMPKIDAEQEKYSSSCTVYWSTAFSVPTTNTENVDAACYLLEAMAYYGREMVRPEYYERTLKHKHLADSDGYRMLDLIFDNRTFDLGAIYNWGDMIQFYNGLVSSKSADIVSQFERNKDRYQNDIDITIDAYKGK